MRNLLDRIKEINEDAARELESAGFTTDQDISSLDRQDLLELLPGKDKLRVRKEIHKFIHNLPPSNKKHSIDDILKNMRGLIPQELLANALSDSGPLEEYLRVLKDHRASLMSVQQMIEAQIDLLERAQTNPDVETRNNVYATNPAHSVINTSTTNPGRWFPPWNFSWSNQHKQAAQRPDLAPVNQSKINTNLMIKPQTATVLYKMVVSGKTLDKHCDIIEKLNGPVPRHNVCLQLHEARDESCQVILLFCPVVSRMGTDLDAALRQISSDRPLIVVVMHHMHTPTSLPAPKTRSTHDLGVNVFFHETVNGLLSCPQNEAAITEMKTKLLEYSAKRIWTN